MKHLINQTDAAQICGVNRSNIQALSKTKWKFFDGTMIDTDHPDWQRYVDMCKIKNSVKAEANKNKDVTNKTSSGIRDGKIISTSKSQKMDAEKTRQDKQKAKSKNKKNNNEDDEYENDSIDIDNFFPTSLRDLKTKTEIEKMMIEIHARYGELIDRKIVENKIAKIGQMMQSNFVDLPKRTSHKIAVACGCVGMEKKIEKILGEDVQKSIQSLKRSVIENPNEKK